MENIMRLILALPVLVLFAGCTADRVETARHAAAPAEPIPIRFHLAADQPTDGYRPVPDKDGRTIYVAPEPALTEADMASARPAQDSLGRPCVDVAMTDAGAAKLKELTRNNIGNKLAIFVDGELMTAPTIQSVVSQRAQISGHFTPERARQIADSLNAR
jgi:preprotein translocase subunit SecD